MALLTLSGIPCGSPSIVVIPLNGATWADVTLAVTSAPFSVGDSVQLVVEGGQTWAMTVDTIGPDGGFIKAKLIGGANCLGVGIQPRFYANTPATTIMREILRDCGETPGELNLPPDPLPQWIRPGGPASGAIRALMMRYPDLTWQIKPNGRVNVELPAWPQHEPELPVESSDPAAGIWTCALDTGVVAGQTVTMRRGPELITKRATRVNHVIEDNYDYDQFHSGVQTTLRTIIATGDGRDQGPSALEQLAQQALQHTDYLAMYPCAVIRDHGDHTLDLRPEHPHLPTMTKVRMIQPLPGTLVRLKAGSRVLLTFMQGDPSRPLVMGYGEAILELLDITTGKGQRIVLDDDRGQVSPDDSIYLRPSVLIQDQAGQKVELWAQKGKEKVTVQDKTGQSVVLDPVAKTVSVTALTVLNLTGAKVRINGDGQPVARVGDRVDLQTGLIVSGSPTVVSG